jgi:predicted amidohydrolase
MDGGQRWLVVSSFSGVSHGVTGEEDLSVPLAACNFTCHAMQPSAALECGCLVLSSCLIALDWDMQCVFGAASGVVLPWETCLGHDQPRLGCCPGLPWCLGSG